MKTRRLMLNAALMLLLVFASAGHVFAGNGNGKGGGGTTTPDYGDLFVLHRDVNGVPILDEDSCERPIAAAEFEGCQNLPGGGPCLLIPLDPATCAVLPEYETYVQEVEFGRIDEVRSPDSVFAQQLEEATIRLATAGCISLDAAGRLVTSSTIDGEVVSAAIDSPLQNLAIYRQLMLTGTLGESLQLPAGSADWLLTAARSLGAASDKDGAVTVDMVVYLNQIMGLAETSKELPIICQEDVKKEVQGEIVFVDKCYVDLSGLSYARGDNFASLPDPPYIPAESPQPGWFEYLAAAGESFALVQGPILGAVPALAEDSAKENIAGFAQAADDTRAVIEFMHSWPVPEGYATPLSCEMESEGCDVSISDVSGLQVPARMVAGTEGREGSVTVINAGPDDASGTVQVKGVSDGDEEIMLYSVEDGVSTGESIFVQPEPFIIPAGTSRTWTFFFSVDYPTVIEWTATAVVDEPNDVNPANNTVSEKTTVFRGGGKKR